MGTPPNNSKMKGVKGRQRILSLDQVVVYFTTYIWQMPPNHVPPSVSDKMGNMRGEKKKKTSTGKKEERKRFCGVTDNEFEVADKAQYILAPKTLESILSARNLFQHGPSGGWASILSLQFRSQGIKSVQETHVSDIETCKRYVIISD